MKFSAVKLLIPFLVFFLVLQSCKKEWGEKITDLNPQLIQNFFAISPNAHPEVSKIVNNWSKQKGFKEQLGAFVKKNGIPVWNKTFVQMISNSSSGIKGKAQNDTSSSAGLFFIPLQDTLSSEIKSYVVCSKHDDSTYSYRLYNKQEVSGIAANTNDTLKRARNITLSIFAYFEKEINNKDSTFFGGQTNKTMRNISIVSASSGNAGAGNRVNDNSSYILCGFWYTITIVTEVYSDNTYGTVLETCNLNYYLFCGTEIGSGGGTSGWDPGNVGIPGDLSGGMPGSGSVYYYTGGSSGTSNYGWWSYGSGYNGIYINGAWYDPTFLYPSWSGPSETFYYSAEQTMLYNLKVEIGLTESQFDILNSNLNMVSALKAFRDNGNQTLEEKAAAIKEHIDEMVTNPVYLNFVQNYTLNINSGKVWWDDDVWLNANFPGVYSNIQALNLFPKQAYYLSNNLLINQDIKTFLYENENTEEAKLAAKITIDVSNAGILTDPNSPLHYSIALNYLPSCCPSGPILGTQYLGYITNRMAVLRHQGDCNYFITCYAMAVKDVLQTGLDIIGLIPVAGEVADVTNGIIYTISGDLTNASLSFAATIPVAGWTATGVKWARKAVTLSNGTKTALNWYKRTDGVISFGKQNSAQFRKLLGLATGDIRQAHHIIPWELAEDGTIEVIQKAAGANFPFHVQDILNGIPLSPLQHKGSHDLYTGRVRSALNDIKQRFGASLTPEIAYNEIVDLTNRIKEAILANPNTNIENIIF